MAECKVITLRVSLEEARKADLVARTEGVSVNEVFRCALAHYLDVKREDPDFVARAQAMVARDAEIVGELR